MLYINDVHILIYVLVAFVGAIVGQFIDYLNITFLNERKVLSKNSYKEYKKIRRINYKIIIVNTLLYIALLYKFKVSLDFARFAILTPMLISAFVVDYKIQIIPNRLNLTMFEVGIIFAFIFGIQNLNVAKDMLLRNAFRRGNFPRHYTNWRTNCRKRSNGARRCKTNGGIRFIFWNV